MIKNAYASEVCCEQRHTELQLPHWMSTRLGRWLAKRWRPAARRWMQEIERALIVEAQRELEARTVRLLSAMDNGMMLPSGFLQSEEFLSALVYWRNAAARLVERKSRALEKGIR